MNQYRRIQELARSPVNSAISFVIYGLDEILILYIPIAFTVVMQAGAIEICYSFQLLYMRDTSHNCCGTGRMPVLEYLFARCLIVRLIVICQLDPAGKNSCFGAAIDQQLQDWFAAKRGLSMRINS